MTQISVFLLFTAFLSLGNAQDSSADPYCYSQDKIFKRCQDQNVIFQRATAQAKKENKQVLIVHGYELCLWCESLVKAFYFSDYAADIQSRFVVTPIATSAIYKTGSELVANLTKDAGQSAPEGYPYLFVYDPKTLKGSGFNPVENERNTDETKLVPAYYGYDVEAVLKKINVESSKIKGI